MGNRETDDKTALAACLRLVWQLLLRLSPLDDLHVTHFAEKDRLADLLVQESVELLCDSVPRGIVVLAPCVEVAILVAIPQLRAGEPAEPEDVAVRASIRPASRRRLLHHVLVLFDPRLEFPEPAFFDVETRHVEHGYPGRRMRNASLKGIRPMLAVVVHANP